MRKVANGTAVAWNGKAALILGPPGSGKSDLALRLIEGGAQLIADDLVELTRSGAQVMAAFPGDAPPELRGRIEARGLGVHRTVVLHEALELSVCLVEVTARERHVTAQDRSFIAQRSFREARLKLIEQVERGIRLLALIARVRGLKQRVREPRRAR